jgi:tetratricopeptide (TPR) repeat protein
LNDGFHESLKRRLSRFDGQYLPPSKRRPSDTGKADLEAVPYDPKRTAMIAQAELLAGKLERCRILLEKVDPKDARHADILWVRSLLAITEADPTGALKSLDELLNSAHDGYFVRLQRALAYRMKNESTAEETELLAAHRFYPTASEPLYRLMNLAQASTDRSKELKYVADLCNLEESDVHLHQRHVELRLALKQTDLAWKAAEALLFVDPLNPESQYLVAKIATEKHDRAAARKAYDLALLLARSPADRERLEGLKRNP